MQTAVDKGIHLITEYEVTNCCTDQGLLKEVADSTKIMLEIETIEITADKGYESREDILNCVMNGIIPNVAMKYDKEERLYSIDYVEAKISEEEKHSTKPEDIQKCIATGVHHTLDRNDFTSKKVILRIKEDIHKMKERMCLSEHPFGTVKWYHGAHYILCKGKEKATAELVYMAK